MSLSDVPGAPQRSLAAPFALFFVQCVALVWVGRSLFHTPGFPLDDAWIHHVVARNLADHGTYGVTPSTHSSGTSSLLWTLLLALGHALHVSPPCWTHALGAVLFIAFGQCFFHLARCDGFSAWRSFALAAATCTGNVVWFAFSGMEAMLLCALSVTSVALWFAPGSPWRASIPLSLLSLTRIDALAFPAVLALAHRAAGRPRRDALYLLLLPSTAFAAWTVLNLRLLGTPLPSTLAGRRWLNHLGAPPYGLRSLRWLLRRWPLRLGADTLLSQHTLVAVVAAALVVIGAVLLRRGQRRRLGVLVALAFVHLFTFALFFPVTGHGGRYQPLIPTLFLPLALVSLWSFSTRMARHLSARALNALVVGVAALVMVVVVRSLVHWATILASGVDHIEGTERAMGEWIRAHLSPAARVASFDLGAVTYFSRRNVLDLGGLVDPTLAARLSRGETAAYLREHGITHVVIPVGYDDLRRDGLHMGYRLNLHGNPSVRLVPIHREVTPWSRWWPAALPTGHASPQQVLYRFELLPTPSHGG